MTTSPTRQTELNFIDAFKEIIIGKMVTRLEWNNPNIFCCIKDEKVMIHRDSLYKEWIISTGDIEGEDWVLINSN